MRLNLACGDRPRPGYLNLDIIPGKGDRQADCLDLDEFASGSIKEILAEHFVEHLTRPQLFAFFEQARLLLAPGRALTLRTPCMRCLVLAAASGEINLELLDLELFARHLHEHDFHRQGFWEEKFARLCASFGFSDPEFEHGDGYEITMTARRLPT